ncbi:MAG: LptF/LptG family permease [Myxococcota bacterium]
MSPSERRSRPALPGVKLSRYLVSEMWLPSLFATAAFGLVVLLTDLLGYADLIVNRGLAVEEVARLAGLQLIPTLARTLPFAVLVGTLVGLGRLAADRELLALEASGFSPRQLAVPGLVFAFFATVVSLYLSVFLSPDSQRQVRDRMVALTRARPGLSLRAGQASNLDGWRIEARKVDQEGTFLEGVLVYMPSLDETIFSQHGTILDARGSRPAVPIPDPAPAAGSAASAANGPTASNAATAAPGAAPAAAPTPTATPTPAAASATATASATTTTTASATPPADAAATPSPPDAAPAKRIVLEDGLILFNSEDRASLLRFDRLETRLPASKPGKDVPVDLVATLPFSELLAVSAEEGNSARGRWYRGEAHRRVALGAATLPFGLLAMGLALGRRTLSRSTGTAMGIGGAIAYYALVQLAEGLLRGERTPVALAIWLPNLVLGGVASFLVLKAGRRTEDGYRGTGRGSRSLLERLGLARKGIRVKRFALPRYVAGQFLQMALACVAGLVLAYLIIDVFDNLKWFNRYGATGEEIARYYIARLPVLAARVIPMALLIAVALTISVLGANGELLGMRACGIPILRILAPVWILCALAVPADHLLANELVPRSSGRAAEIKRVEIKNQNDVSRDARERVWYRVGKRIHEMGRLDLLRGLASSVTLYELDDEGLPKRRTDAAGARSLGGGNWLLDAPRAVALLPTGHLSRTPHAERLVQFGEEAPAEIETADLTPAELQTALADPDIEGPTALIYRTDLQMKISAPFACLLLPLIALFFAATGPPFPRPVQMLIASAILAVAHAIATSFAGSMGHGGTLPPWLAGWGPSLIFAAVAIAMGVRQRIRSQTSG